MLAQALLSGSVCKNVILKEYIKTKTNPSYLWAMDGCYNNYIADDDFTGNDGDPPNECLWYKSSTDPILDYTEIESNQLKFNTESNLVDFTNSHIISRFNIRGDFDLQYKTDTSTAVNEKTWQFYILLIPVENPSYYLGTERVFSVGDMVRTFKGTPTWSEVASVSTTSDTVSFRVVRIGSTWNMYHDLAGGNNWSLTSTTTDPSFDGDVSIRFYLRLSINHIPTEAFLDDFIINSGEVIWPVNEEIVGNHGEVINEPIAQQPPLTAYSLPTDKSFLINGSTQAIDTNLTVSSQASRTVLMTFEMTDFPEPQLLFSDGDYEGLTKRLHLGINTDYWAYIISDGVESFDESNVHLHNLIVGEKYIVAYVIDDHDVTIYVNGIASASFTIPATIDPAVGVGDLMIGKDGSADLFYGNFYVDLFVVYDEALSLTDIRASAGIFLTGNECLSL